MVHSSVNGFAIVTGAAGGIGKEIVFALAEAGAKGVLCADLKGDEASKVAEESKSFATVLDFRAFVFEVDITDAQSVQALAEFGLKQFGRVDYLVNAAGIDVESVVPFHQTSDEDFSRVFDVNARGAFLLSKMIAPVMASQEPYTVETNRFGTRQLSRGAIVHIASAMAFGAVPCKTPYITAKHALLGITRSSAMDLNQAGVRVNMVSPTWVETPMLEGNRKRVPIIDDIIRKAVPNGRPVGPDEVAAAALYLCGPHSSFITGSNIMIDGGLSIGPTFR